MSPTMGNPITEETKGKGDETSTLLCLGFFVVVIIGTFCVISDHPPVLPAGRLSVCPPVKVPAQSPMLFVRPTRPS